MYKTQLNLGSASTAHGMRRILKHLPPVPKYIRQAVEAGIYYKEPKDQQQDGRRPPKRTTPYGTSIADYPIEYQILSLHPPIPPKPRVPKKLQPKKPTLPTEKLAKQYLKRNNNGGVESEKNNYYQRILGIPSTNSKTSNMGFKSHQINKAYAVAMKQYEVMRTQDMDEDEALQVVEKLLKEQEVHERQTSRTITKTIVQETKQKQTKQEKTSAEKNDYNGMHEKDSVPSVLHSKPKTIHGLTIWSKRLATIPYREWTVGATTALDHWIARSILNLQEDTWQQLLEGSSPELTSQGRDIIQARHALFPETIIQTQHHESKEEEEEEVAELSSKEKTIEELLASLGAFDDDEDDDDEGEEEGDLDSKVSNLVDKLQSWRQKQSETPYEEWTSEDQEAFGTWLEHYVSTLAVDANDKVVDMDKTRQALLSVPPMTQQESDEFWSHLADEASAAEWLQTVDMSTLTPEQSRVLDAFQQLPFETQVSRLVELGTLEPLWNEYTPESVRIEFLQRHFRKLLHGLDMEHLVSDPRGPITAQDMGENWMELHGIVNKEERFAIKKMPQDSDVDCLDEYTTHKAGRARYEEFMFQQGKLGLQYNAKTTADDEPKNEKEE